MTELRKICYILRHAKAMPAGPGQLDEERPLSARGIRHARQMGHYLKEKAYRPALVLCSSSHRTRETLANLMAYLPENVVIRIEDDLYLASRSALTARLKRVPDTVSSVMIVGHNPGLENLAAYLADGGAPELDKKLATKFPTAALARLECAAVSWRALEKGGARLTDLAYPRDVETDATAANAPT